MGPDQPATCSTAGPLFDGRDLSITCSGRRHEFVLFYAVLLLTRGSTWAAWNLTLPIGEGSYRTALFYALPPSELAHSFVDGARSGIALRMAFAVGIFY